MILGKSVEDLINFVLLRNSIKENELEIKAGFDYATGRLLEGEREMVETSIRQALNFGARNYARGCREALALYEQTEKDS